MSIVGVFTQSRPEIGGMFFDATIQESTELVTDVTEFPIESGDTGNDHAVTRPLVISMRVGISDNAFRAAREIAGGGVLGPLTGNLFGAGVGAAIGQLGGGAAAAAGLIAGGVNAARTAGQASTRSQEALDSIRDMQVRKSAVNVITLKKEYPNCIITNTRQETNKENENALDLVIELRQIIVVPLDDGESDIPATNDTAATQAQKFRNVGVL